MTKKTKPKPKTLEQLRKQAAILPSPGMYELRRVVETPHADARRTHWGFEGRVLPGIFLLTGEHGRWVAFLLRLSMLGSQRRASTLWSQPGRYSVRPLARRPAFIRPRKPLRSDNSEYAIFLWQHGYQGVAQLLPPLDVPLASRRRVG